MPSISTKPCLAGAVLLLVPGFAYAMGGEYMAEGVFYLILAVASLVAAVSPVLLGTMLAVVVCLLPARIEDPT
jgi:asparagine N-glycosylation enzyme membrane subunit Stt3